MSDEQLQQLLAQNDGRFFQQQNILESIDEDELEDDDAEEDEGGDGTHGTPDDEKELEDEGGSSQIEFDENEEFDVLKWWKSKERMFPILAQMAKQVLPMPVSTIVVEQEFSSAGNVLTASRTSLSAESLETLICYHDWLKAIRRTQEISITPSQDFMDESTTEVAPMPEIPID
ncbi:unnamed protein product [Cuscuta epithymum]|uniref:HAT C-terminal dimerisation domain-containing protein n=1 Tax=Cuscuta epithymum TaxID=186058 RepID=A0AAV0DXU9_9ASTE|nr:unnamed protein product [Cuscuta epithymum]